MVISRFVNRYTTNFKNLPLVINCIKRNNQLPIIDYANENPNKAKFNFDVIHNLITNNPNNTFAIKFSGLGCLTNEIQAINLAEELILHAIANNSKVMIDAEQDIIQEFINNETNNLIDKYNKDSLNIFKTYQMYRIDTFNELKRDMNYFRNHYIGIKLVRGAYYNTDKVTGKLFQHKSDTDTNFNNGIHLFDQNRNLNHHMVLATHNKKSIELLEGCRHPNVSIAHLQGFSDDLSNTMVTKGYPVYKYLPVGNYIDTFPYLLRRVYENYPILLHL